MTQQRGPALHYHWRRPPPTTSNHLHAMHTPLCQVMLPPQAWRAGGRGVLRTDVGQRETNVQDDHHLCAAAGVNHHVVASATGAIDRIRNIW